jgi:rhodanese-related sulfurtransferase
MFTSKWRTVLKITLPVALIILALPAAAFDIVTDIDASNVSKSRITPLALYLSPKAAHQALSRNPEILFVDVRDPIEIGFIGHPASMDKIIPVAIVTHEFDAKRGGYKMISNPNFVAEMDALLKREGLTKSDPVFVSCRSGSRSAAAARRLIAAGYSNVWNLVEGFEGDKNKDGARAVNGWRNAGLPWSYKIPANAAWTPIAK